MTETKPSVSISQLGPVSDIIGEAILALLTGETAEVRNLVANATNKLETVLENYETNDSEVRRKVTYAYDSLTLNLVGNLALERASQLRTAMQILVRVHAQINLAYGRLSD